MNTIDCEKIVYEPKINKNLFLSIVVRFYNQEKFVDCCLSSIFNQVTKYSFEVIIADDGSNDGTIEKALKWSNKYPDQIKINVMDRDSQKKYNSILRASRNSLSALKRANGKYVCFIDGDDYFCSNSKFEGQIALLEKYPKACACLSGYIVKDSDGTKKKILNFPEYFKTREYVKHSFVHAASIVFRNHSFECYDDNFDDDNIFTLFNNSKFICYFNDATFCYVKADSGSWSSKNKLEKKYYALRNLNDVFSFYNGRKFPYIYKNVGLILGLFENKSFYAKLCENKIRLSDCKFLLMFLNDYKQFNFFRFLVLRVYSVFFKMLYILKKRNKKEYNKTFLITDNGEG